MAEKHRDYTSFIWLKNVNKIDYENFATNEFIELRFCRVLFGITSSPFLLNATVRYDILNYQEIQPDIIKTLLISLHVHDFNTGANILLEAFDLYVNAKIF